MSTSSAGRRFRPRIFPLFAAALWLWTETSIYAQTGIRPSASASSGGAARTGATTRQAGAGTGGRATGGTGGTATGGARQYRSNTLLGDATIEIDPETRSLVIVTDEDTHLQLSNVIKTLDRPKPQVLIKVVFVEVTYNKGYDLGVEGSYTFKIGNPATPATTTNTTNTTTTNGTTANGGTTQAVTTVTQAATAAATLASGVSSAFGLSSATQGTFVRVLTDDWSATLHALETKGKVEILSRPSIMARNNQEAVIVVGQEVPFITNSRITDNGETINTIQYDNVGIILRVTPYITSEGSVEMIVAPEISALTDQTVPISNNAAAPVISKRSAETVVVTPNAQTVVIGGMLQTQRTESIQKIPILGDIPYLGIPFRRTVKNDVKSELMVFLTPYIVNSDEKIDQITRRELDQTRVTETFPEVSMPELDPLPQLDDPKEIRPAIPVEQSRAVTPRRRVKTETTTARRTTTTTVAPR
jgi:general secretion pathway protein D